VGVRQRMIPLVIAPATAKKSPRAAHSELFIGTIVRPTDGLVTALGVDFRPTWEHPPHFSPFPGERTTISVGTKYARRAVESAEIGG
jgi:hypothetical protein